MKLKHVLILAAIHAIGGAPSFAQLPANTNSNEHVLVEKVEIRGKADGDVFSYAKAYALLLKFSRLSGVDDLLLSFYLRPRDAAMKPADVRVTLEGEKYFEKIELKPDWQLMVPFNEQAMLENADFVLNVLPNKLRRIGVIEIRVPKTQTVPVRYF